MGGKSKSHFSILQLVVVALILVSAVGLGYAATKSSDTISGSDESCENGVCAAKSAVEAVVDVQLPKGANKEGKPREVKVGDCQDRAERCKTYLQQGECQKNPGWMIVNCPSSCKACKFTKKMYLKL